MANITTTTQLPSRVKLSKQRVTSGTIFQMTVMTKKLTKETRIRTTKIMKEASVMMEKALDLVNLRQKTLLVITRIN